MLRDIFRVKKSEKNFGPKLSRRKFFGFSLCAGAAAAVAPAVVRGMDMGVVGGTGTMGLRHYQHAAIDRVLLDDYYAQLAAYCEADCHLGFIYSSEYRQYRKKWALARGYGMGKDGIERSLGKHPALGMGYEPLKFPNRPRYPWPT